MQTYKFEMLFELPIARIFVDGYKTTAYVELSAENAGEYGMLEQYMEWAKGDF